MKATITIDPDEVERMKAVVREMDEEPWCSVTAEYREHSDGKGVSVDLDLSADWVLFHLGALFELRRNHERVWT